MTSARETLQTIARLTPLDDLLALIARAVTPVAPGALDLAAAMGCTLAADVVAPARPSSALALIDGWALSADATLDAGGYAPAVLPVVPERVEVGQAMPPGTDCVAPFDAVKVAGGVAEALATIGPGDGMLPAGGDIQAATVLRQAGERLRRVDLAVCAAAGLARVTVRQPRLRIVPLRGTAIVAAAAQAVAADIERLGGIAHLDESCPDLASVLHAEPSDAVIAVGGTGAGRNDSAVRALRELGRLAVHGVALTPGETAAFGFVDVRPVLLLPGRLDAALAVWLVVGRSVLARLAAADTDKESEPAVTWPLTRKVTSTVGLTELVPVRRAGDGVEPLASKYLPLSALARADGWILVPAASEGYSEGALVSVSPWP